MLKKLFAFRHPKKTGVPFEALFRKFKGLLERNNRILELMGDMCDKLGGEYVFDKQYIISSCEEIGDQVFKLISDMSVLSRNGHADLFPAFERIRYAVNEELAGRHAFPQASLTIPFADLGSESVQAAGNKMSTLGVIRNMLGYSVPDGFVVTTKAFFDFLDFSGLREEALRKLETWDRKDEARFEAICGDMRSLVMGSPVPDPIKAAISARVEALESEAHIRGDRKPRLFAVRSSAWDEDGENSFAGQYRTLLGVKAVDLAEAYKEVVAGAFSPEAWRYRIEHGYREDELAMAVGVQVMVDSEISGVLNTYSPVPGQEDAMVVHSTPGLGAPVMDGMVRTDTIVLDRMPPFARRSAKTRPWDRRLRLNPEGGSVWEDLPAESSGLLPTQEQFVELAKAGLDIESYLKRPLEVEWSIDANGELNILQARPVRVDEGDCFPSAVPEDVDAEALPLKGEIVQQGVATGQVFIVKNDEELSVFPYGAILVSRFTSPRFSRVMSQAKGIITDVGSAAGHMATIAREYRVPTLVNTGLATELLENGQEVTLDASHNAVYPGIINELRRFELTEQCVFENSYEYRLLRRVLDLITPLHMVEPRSETFKPSNCRTYHDITRYIHEKAVEELIDLSMNRELSEVKARRLVSDIPLGLMVLDIEETPLDGDEEKKEEVRLDDVHSIPLKTILEGVEKSGMWNNNPVPVDFGSFMSSFTRTISASLATPQRIGRNLAVVSEHYLNLHLRLGYHFNIIDAYMDETANDNYIYFRFLGGVTGFKRRSRRARFISEILERFDFRIEVRGDLVIGRIKRISLPRAIEKMTVLGGLVAYTRQLDVVLCSENDLREHVKQFMERITPVLEERKWAMHAQRPGY